MVSQLFKDLDGMIEKDAKLRKTLGDLNDQLETKKERTEEELKAITFKIVKHTKE